MSSNTTAVIIFMFLKYMIYFIIFFRYRENMNKKRKRRLKLSFTKTPFPLGFSSTVALLRLAGMIIRHSFIQLTKSMSWSVFNPVTCSVLWEQLTLKWVLCSDFFQSNFNWSSLMLELGSVRYGKDDTHLNNLGNLFGFLTMTCDFRAEVSLSW